MAKDVGIWIRVSTLDQAEGDSPEVHEKRGRMFCEAKGFNVKEVYHLEAVSGKTVIEHPEAKRMLSDIKKGNITGLVFSKLARFTRNTRELLEFSDIFRQYNADLISIEESIDTSSPAGRLFYTVIAAMAQWEREEIANRVKVSIPIRAKLGKSLGGEAPFGYKWVNKELELDENEVPVRKLIYDLFIQHRQIGKVVNALNKKGYRTRRGQDFTGTTIRRLIEDPIAKGLRRVNYTQSDNSNKSWKLKPQDEWIFQPVPAIITEEVWQQCNDILVSLINPKKKLRRPTKRLFAGILSCECGGKMYLRSRSPKYVCGKCSNKIGPDDLEHIFQEQLKDFLYSKENLEKQLADEKEIVTKNLQEIAAHQKRIAELKTKTMGAVDLFNSGELKKEAFSAYYKPLQEELEQRENSVLELQTANSLLNMQSLSSEEVIHEAKDLHSQWEGFTYEEKHSIIETITEAIIVGEEDIEIKLKYLPTLGPKRANDNPSTIVLFQFNTPQTQSSFELVQKFNTALPLRVLQPP